MVQSLAVGCTVNNGCKVVWDAEKRKFECIGSPTDGACKTIAEKLCGDPSSKDKAFEFEKEMNRKLEKVAVLDFTSDRMTMSTVVSGYKNDKDLLLKGAPDRVIDKCTSFVCLTSG